MDNAKRENDPEKKAKLYVMAEKVLQSSAGSFTKGRAPRKKGTSIETAGESGERNGN